MKNFKLIKESWDRFVTEQEKVDLPFMDIGDKTFGSVEELNKLKKQALTHQIPSLFSKKPSSLNTESVNTPFGKVPARMFKRQSHKQYNSGENNINSTRRTHRTRRNRN